MATLDDTSIDYFATLIRERRKKLRLTQVQFAKLLGCAQSAVSDYEHGARVPTNIAVLRRICKALKIPLGRLVG